MVKALEKLPVSVIVVTKNEQDRIGSCLHVLGDFDDIIVVDSDSDDRTVEVAQTCGAKVVQFEWNGQYPKKRQWCLDTLDFKHDWVFFVDADEIVTPALVQEIRDVFSSDVPTRTAGFFVYGRYVWGGRPLRFGLKNNKLCLLHRQRMCFPVVDDLGVDGMGEIEGHYQPVLSESGGGYEIGQLRRVLLHYAYDDPAHWNARHVRYARWEAQMNARAAWPDDPIPWRQSVKVFLRQSFFRPYVVFIYSYIVCLGFLDGRAGYSFARSRMHYAKRILREMKSTTNS